MDASPKRTAVYIITGYAAAGKTSLLNLLLRSCSNSGAAAAVVVHRQAEEYGIVPHAIEQDLAVAYEEVFDFGSGCLCCSPQGEMTRLLRTLAGRPDLDVLFIKTAPLAAPLLFAKSLVSSDDAIAARCDLRSILAVVDPTLAPFHLCAGGDEWQAVSQVRAADCIVFNGRGDAAESANNVDQAATAPTPQEASVAKAKVAEAAELEAAIELVMAHNPAAECVALHTVDDALERAGALLLRRGFSIDAARGLDPSFDAASAQPPSLVSLRGHDRRIIAGCAVEDAPLHEAKLRALLTSLVESGGCLRCKAVVRLHGEVAVGASSCGAPEGEWARIDGVERRLTFRKGGGAPSAAAGTEGQMPPSKLFVLARGSLPLGSLRRRFQECAVHDGFELAADAELNFGGAPRNGVAAAWSDDLRGVLIVCGGGRYAALEQQQPFGSLLVHGATGAPPPLPTHGEMAAAATLRLDPQCGVVCSVAAVPSSGRGACEYRLIDGASIGADEAIDVATGSSGVRVAGEVLRLRAVQVIGDGIYVGGRLM